MSDPETAAIHFWSPGGVRRRSQCAASATAAVAAAAAAAAAPNALCIANLLIKT